MIRHRTAPRVYLDTENVERAACSLPEAKRHDFRQKVMSILSVNVRKHQFASSLQVARAIERALAEMQVGR
jgi:hypothetical protein